MKQIYTFFLFLTFAVVIADLRANSPGATVISVRTLLNGRVCRVTQEIARTQDAVTQRPSNIVFFRYRPITIPQYSGTVIIHPSGFGVSPNEGAFARSFCNRGLQTLIVKSFAHDHDVDLEWDSDDKLLKRGQTVMNSLANLSHGPVAMMGFSIGAIFSLSAALSNSKIKAVVLIAAGLPFADVLASTQEPSHKAQRKKRLKLYAIQDFSDYLQKVRDSLPNDPVLKLKTAPKHFASLLVIAGKDTWMPTKNQWILWKLLGRPKILEEKNSGHLGAVIKSYFKYGSEIGDFFEDHLFLSRNLNP